MLASSRFIQRLLFYVGFSLEMVKGGCTFTIQFQTIGRPVSTKFKRRETSLDTVVENESMHFLGEQHCFAGYDVLDSVIILSNQKTVDKLKKAGPNYGVDINLIVGKDTALAQTDDTWTEEQTAVSHYLLPILANSILPWRAVSQLWYIYSGANMSVYTIGRLSLGKSWESGLT